MHLSKLILPVFMFVISAGFAQSTIYDTIRHDNLDRNYILYVPQIYDGSEAVPLVLNLHGYTRNAGLQMNSGDFRPIADTANFIIAHPNGTKDQGGAPFWEVGLFGGTSGINDLGFLEALVDTLMEQYNIDPDKIFSTGMSNGGFMSLKLACESDKFAAVASVTGSMTTPMENSCNPSAPIPMMQIHGTADSVVQYLGRPGILPIDSVIAYWVRHNNCDKTPEKSNIPDLDPNDGTTSERFVYANGDDGSSVELIKVENGGHSWPGSSNPIFTTSMDFSASAEIWRFFSVGNPKTTSIPSVNSAQSGIRVFPNPSSGFLKIQSEFKTVSNIEIYDIIGNLQLAEQFTGNTSLDLSPLSSGTYFVLIENNGKRFF
ncbi:MAG: T9SS type A sorting domain-containing protein, partial [Chitinophagales bacterium]